MNRYHHILVSLCILGFAPCVPARGNAKANDEIKARLAPALALSVQELQLALSVKFHALFDGASVIADDDEHTFLGKIGNTVASDSIFNTVGHHGSTVSSQSIWNEVGRFGGEVARLSPFNPVTSSPPFIVKDGKVVGRLTVNEVVRGAIDPNLLKALFK